jgi:serine/threonine protein kinase
LFLVSNHVKVADFGLVNSLSDAAKLNAALNAVTPLYAAPELFLGKLSRHCDQYSLAISYQELLTGILPFTGKNMRQLLLQHTQEEPNLTSLPSHDRAIIARALAKQPENRFKSCMELVRALQADMTKPTSDSKSDLTLASTAAAREETAMLQPAETTELPSAPKRPALPEGVLADHRFGNCLMNSPLMEVWKATAADGIRKCIKIMYGLGCSKIDKLKEALGRLHSIHHPALLTPEVVHVAPGRLILQTAFVRETLRSRAHQCQARKQPGIPRAELIDYLRAAAEVLDYLYQQHSVQHLNLNPRNLVLDHGWLQIDEFGYAQLLWAPAGQAFAQRNERYAAPELFTTGMSRQSDEYSLALIYAEMLTGVHPLGGRGTRKIEPNLDRLPERDRAVILRALDADPSKRFSNCTEMLLALEEKSPELNRPGEDKSDPFVRLVVSERNANRKPTSSGEGDVNFHEIIGKLIGDAGGKVEPIADTMPTISASREAASYQFVAGLPLGSAQERLHHFSQETFANLIAQNEAHCTMQFDLPSSFWQNWWGQPPKLELHVELARVQPMSATPIAVKAELRTRHCAKKQAVAIFQKMGQEIFESLQQHLVVNSEKRAKDRLLWPHPIKITPIGKCGESGEPIECRGKDLSQTGMGFYLPHELDTAEVLIELPDPASSTTVKVAATLVRAKRCADGWYDVGALFRVPAQRKSWAEVRV